MKRLLTLGQYPFDSRSRNQLSQRLGMALLIGALLLLLASGPRAWAQGAPGPFVLVVELEIVPSELEK